mmetsp:Transcript_119986/g.267866  ORF Transcript_119986/g.267866 Transcript_119986/m.267866 type:complete len:263 (+) Transcript_119986:204-992(+)
MPRLSAAAGRHRLHRATSGRGNYPEVSTLGTGSKSSTSSRTCCDRAFVKASIVLPVASEDGEAEAHSGCAIERRNAEAYEILGLQPNPSMNALAVHKCAGTAQVRQKQIAILDCNLEVLARDGIPFGLIRHERGPERCGLQGPAHTKLGLQAAGLQKAALQRQATQVVGGKATRGGALQRERRGQGTKSDLHHGEGLLWGRNCGGWGSGDRGSSDADRGGGGAVGDGCRGHHRPQWILQGCRSGRRGQRHRDRRRLERVWRT